MTSGGRVKLCGSILALAGDCISASLVHVERCILDKSGERACAKD